MDHFGIGAAVQGALRILAVSARRTGRSTSLLDSLRDGDRIVFLDAAESQRMARLARERKLQVECIVLPVDCAEGLFHRPPSDGRTLFDHSWVEAFYMRAIDQCEKQIDHLQRESSGYGSAHIETRMKAEQLQKWR